MECPPLKCKGDLVHLASVDTQEPPSVLAASVVTVGSGRLARSAVGVEKHLRL